MVGREEHRRQRKRLRHAHKVVVGAIETDGGERVADAKVPQHHLTRHQDVELLRLVQGVLEDKHAWAAAAAAAAQPPTPTSTPSASSSSAAAANAGRAGAATPQLVDGALVQAQPLRRRLCQQRAKLHKVAAPRVQHYAPPAVSVKGGPMDVVVQLEAPQPRGACHPLIGQREGAAHAAILAGWRTARGLDLIRSQGRWSLEVEEHVGPAWQPVQLECRQLPDWRRHRSLSSIAEPAKGRAGAHVPNGALPGGIRTGKQTALVDQGAAHCALWGPSHNRHLCLVSI